MGTSGFILIPMTPPTKYVTECAKCGFSGQANTVLGPSPKFKMDIRVTLKQMYARNARARIRAMHVIGFLHAEVVWHKPIIACYLVLPWRIRIGIGVGIGCAVAVEHLVWANEISVFSYVEISAVLTYGNEEFACRQISLRNDLRTAFACHHLRLKYYHKSSCAWQNVVAALYCVWQNVVKPTRTPLA